ncbi:hypothetical protein BUALT_Bualt06G0060000 [Buddleja alternifolia]|uniref:WIYLD domain-containing protein n=1 Tax=Buddleja alternifolia TaxID=168488 RepID=A0AAV6XDA8_9LAMI|nr:hypothetical protein BUALT_Bualt06G0060000 [Buddleja alternifolia]
MFHWRKARFGTQVQTQNRRKARLVTQVEIRNRRKGRLGTQVEIRNRRKVRLGTQVETRNRRKAHLGAEVGAEDGPVRSSGAEVGAKDGPVRSSGAEVSQVGAEDGPTRFTGAEPRLSRMDAAVDAMVPYGFSEERVKNVVKELLKEYGGDEAWPFIEDCSYKELIEALLRDTEGNDQEKVGEDENLPKDKSFEDEKAAGTSARDSDTQPDERADDNAPADVAMSTDAVAEPTCSEVVSSSSGINNAGGDGKGWKDILPDQRSGLIDEEETPNPVHKNDDPVTKIHPPGNNNSIPASPSLSNIPSPPPTNSLPTRRRLPCYGWIESDEEDPDDFIFLRPSIVGLKDLLKSPNDGTKTEKKRKSRWDMGPHDA